MMKKELELAKRIAKEIDVLGGKTYLVGGFVRDELLGIQSKDIDLEIHHITPEQLKEVLSNYGEVDEFGKSFGIFKIKGIDIDFAMPRQERKVGNKHTSFEVDVVPFIGETKAAERRDLTINSIMKNILTNEIVDPFNGVEDLKNKVLRHTNDKTFQEDALRVVRIATFVSRFGFSIADETIDLAKSMTLKDLPKDRIMKELDKVLSKGQSISSFFLSLEKMEQLDYFFPMLKNVGTVYMYSLVDKFFNRFRNTLSKDELLIGILVIMGIEFLEHKNQETFEIFLNSFLNVKSIFKSTNTLLERVSFFLHESKKTDELNMKLISIDLKEKDLTILKSIISVIFEIKINKLQDWIDEMQKTLVNSDDLIQLGFKPGPHFGELLILSKVLQAHGYKRDVILQFIMNKYYM